jgi:DNA-binding NtrC family response regulator
VDFLEKPITLQRLLKTITNGLARDKPVEVANAPVTATIPEPESPQTASGNDDRPSLSVSNTNETESGSGVSGNISLDQPLREARDEFERVYFEYHLARENNSMTRVSERTGLERTHLYRKLKQLGIEARKRQT